MKRLYNSSVRPERSIVSMRSRMGFLFILFISIFSFTKPVKKDAEEVFKRWMLIQWVIPPINIEEMNKYLHDDLIKNVQRDFETNVKYLKLLSDFFNLKYYQDVDDIFSTKSVCVESLQSVFEMTCRKHQTTNNQHPDPSNSLHRRGRPDRL